VEIAMSHKKQINMMLNGKQISAEIEPRRHLVEGLTEQGVLNDLQEAFLRHNALQCGFCTSGMLLAAAELIEHQPKSNREQVREWISGNYCRCTGYHSIVDAIMEVLEARADGRQVKPVTTA